MKRMRTARATAMVLERGCASPALQAQDPPGKQETASREAKATFANVCEACDGLDGRGGERGPDIANRSEVVRKSDAELLGVLREGKPGKGMPAFGAFNEKQLSGLVAFVRGLQGSGKTAVFPGDPTR